MVYLEFVIMAYREGITQQNLEVMVQDCGVTVVESQVLYMASKTCDATMPNFRDGSIKVHFKVRSTQDHLTVQEAYNYLSRDWTNVTRRHSSDFPAHARPVLLLQTSNAFPRVWDATQLDVKLHQFALGTMAYPSQYVEHFRWPSLIEEYSDCPCGVVAHFFHDLKRAEFWFGESCQLSLNYAAIRGIMVKNDGIVDILLNLANPPLVFSMDSVTTYKKTLWQTTRVETIPFCSKSLPPEVLGKSTTLRLRIADQNDAQKLISRLQFRCGRIPVRYVAVDNKYRANPTKLEGRTELPDFECGYLLSALVGRDFVVQLQNVDQWSTFRAFFEKWAVEDPRNLRRTLVDLLRLLDDGVVVNYLGVAVTLVEYYRRTDPEGFPLPRGCCMVPHAVITPTRIILWPKDIMTENRVLRRFDSEYAIRVTFREDNLSKLNLKSSSCAKKIFDKVIRQPMLNGLDIAGRHYDFLAWSNSQLRDHGVYMYAPDGRGNTAVHIRQWMGDLSQITNVAKFMARMGQCFSQTEEPLGVPLDVSRVVTRPDIVGGVHPKTNKPYCFSDGVGQISRELVDEVVKKLNIPSSTSAFQIRYAGCKGMLVLNPDLKDLDIVFRESMNKFPCNGAHKLEIVKASAPVQVFLNRQIITILDHMKVPSCVFLKLQESMLMSLTDMLLEESKAALQLASSCPLQIDFAGLHRSRISLTTEPFFKAMLLATHRAAVDGIKTKARIAIDANVGRYVFGVIDELGKLEYGQIFVKYTTNILDKGGEATVLTGRALVTKNPCLQPGDVRIFEAVDIPELHHIVDCIVFPQKGPRPHPDEMAGSDLDGDEYTVIWNQDLFFKGENAPPETYHTAEAQQSTGPIDVTDMVDCLCQYIVNDHVGVLGNAHLAMADNQRYGLNSDVCRSISNKFNMAVDAAKTGSSWQLDYRERVRFYPDFMEKGGNATSYRSKRTLGKLYRVCRDFEEVNRSSSIVYSDVQVDVDLLYPGWALYKNAAEASRNKYDRHLESILCTYGVTHEAEATAKAFTKLHSLLQERRDKADIEELIAKNVLNLWTNTTLEFWREFGSLPVAEEAVSEAVLRKASAWYAVTYLPARNKAKFLSFPWIMSKQLGLIKLKQMSEREKLGLPRQPSIENLDSCLQNATNSLHALDDESSRLLIGSGLEIPNYTLELATRLLLQWIRHQDLSTSLTTSELQEQDELRHLIPVRTLVRLFLYVTEKSSEQHAQNSPSSVRLFVDFLRFCISLRFMSDWEAKDALPLEVRSSKYLGKVALHTYHCIAIEGNLASAGIAEDSGILQEDHEMEPIRLPIQINDPELTENDYSYVKTMLQDWTGVRVVQIREWRNSLMISAAGSIRAIKNLQVILQKDSHLLKKNLTKN